MKKHLIVVACALVLIGLAVVLPAAAAGGMGEAGSAFERSAHVNIATDPVPAIDIQALTNGQDADTPPGPSVPVGSTVQWTYIVTNTGNVALMNVAVTDDRGVTVSAPGTALDPGESMTATASGTAQAGQYANVGTVTADLPAGPTVTASDPSHYFGTASPEVNFTANTTVGCAPLAVQFTDASTGTITNWIWDFGDGTTSSEQSPTHTYAVAGTYTVNLTVTNPGTTDSEVKANYITVLQNLPPVGGSTAYFLVSTVPPGADIYLEGRDGTRFLKGNTSAGPLNATLYLTAVPMRRVVAVLPGYLEAAWEIASYPSKGETVPVDLVLEPGTGGPFPAPHVPATVIQAEDYDTGGEGAAYHDLEPRNLGGAYRPGEGVDIETAGGVTNVGWIRSGEYLDYTVDTTIAGRFTLVLRAANPDAAPKPVAVLLDGAPVGEVVIGGTGGWTAYGEFAAAEPLYLSAGRHVVSLAFEGVGRVNLDWLRLAAGTVPAVTTTPPSPSGPASFTATPLSAPKGAAVKFRVTPASGKTVRAAWWSFDAPAHLRTWNSRVVNPTFFYPRAGTFSPYVKLTYTDGTTEVVHRVDYVRAT